MKREILFKGFCKRTNKWVEGHLVDKIICDPGERKVTYIYWIEQQDSQLWNVSEEVDPKTVCQFIGKKDKNGKKLFEGDKVKFWESGFEENSTLGEIRYLSENDYPAFDIYPDIDCGSNGLSHVFATGEIEVIGTIHDKETE